MPLQRDVVPQHRLRRTGVASEVDSSKNSYHLAWAMAARSASQPSGVSSSHAGRGVQASIKRYMPRCSRRRTPGASTRTWTSAPRRAKLRGVLGIIATRLAEAPTVDHVLETTAGLASRAVASRGQAV
jgi:DNA-binding CsgD family transcriptional regulator